VAKELRKFCNVGPVELTARVISERAVIDWWVGARPEEALTPTVHG
jgi:hypothetical protein